MRELTDDFQYVRIVNNSTNSTHKRDTLAGTVELELDLDSVSVVSLTSYTTTDSTRYTDADINEEFIFDAYRPEEMDVFTQELRFTSTTDGGIQLAGRRLLLALRGKKCAPPRSGGMRGSMPTATSRGRSAALPKCRPARASGWARS